MYWVLFGEVVLEERLVKFFSYLIDFNEFYCKILFFVLFVVDFDYVGWGDYWFGGVWVFMVYMVFKGLIVVGEDVLVKDLVIKVYDVVVIVFEVIDIFWENYVLDFIFYGMFVKKDFCGWMVLILIVVYKEYIV